MNTVGDWGMFFCQMADIQLLTLQRTHHTTRYVNVDGVWYYFTELGGEYSGWKWDAFAGAWQYENIGKRPTGALEPDKRRNSTL